MSAHETPEERINAARGYKAALHNPHVSPEAKEHARQMLQTIDEDEARQEMHDEGPHHATHHRHHGHAGSAHGHGHERPTSPQERINAARGYKAALSNPLVSMEAKEHARTILTDLDEEGAREELYREKPKSPTRVAGGLRGAQHNPLVSEESRRRAAAKLKDMHEGPAE
ncbi:Con-6 family protein [Aspergillus puulaauensis]|uniref:Conidiation protein 6-domain-containing protein n=1 Tax=Aspergillus puulaauensis TaxID=1220207 RepID=A0A7R8AGR2_9EURO|nr:uncharacterized protein APUU_10464A [Aspergillus puulaauensis]BCS17637.1 hypothetical protein APUU_10464A [Aspergillus puulaauensis]